MSNAFLGKYSPKELRHYAKRAELYGLDKEKEILRRFAHRLSEPGELNQKESEQLQEALKRVVEIPKLSKSCIRQDCETCEKLVDDLGREVKARPWELGIELYRWQKEAKRSWQSNSGRGILKVITGAGKTVVALSLIEELYRRYEGNGIKFVIVVPTTALLDQWKGEIKSTLNVPEEELGVFYGEEKDDMRDNRVMLYVLNSARDNLETHLDRINDDVFLTVDECHRAGSEKNSNIFEGTFDYTLGLSATPERKADYAFEEILTKEIGEVVYSYSYSDAKQDGIIPDYRLKRISVPLTEQEEVAFQKYSDKLNNVSKKLMKSYPALRKAGDGEFLKTLGSLQSQYDDGLLDAYTIVSNKRKSIIHESRSKMAALKYLIKNVIDPRARILIFHERIEYADEIHEFLLEKNINATSYHTKLSGQERRNNLKSYKDGDYNVLVTCRALDEGLDVPDTSVGIIVAATSSVRQRIQRIGRILRKSPGKDYSEIYTIYVKDLEERIFTESDMKNLEKSAEKIEKIQLGFG